MLSIHAQSVTNIGTDFWIAFPSNWTTGTLFVFVSSTVSTNGTVYSAFPGVNQNFTVSPGVVTQLSIPSGVTLQGGVEDKGIRLTTSDPVAVYGLSRVAASTDAFLALPINALGTDYRIMAYPVSINAKGSCLSVVATQDGTTLTIFNKLSGSTFTINLNMGQTYYLKSTTLLDDLTGSRVQSNYPVAVFGSDEITNIPNASCVAGDFIVEQMFPWYSWGKNFVTVPLAGRDNSGDVYRILAAEDGTTVEIDGSLVATIDEGDYFQSNLLGYNEISTSKPTLLAQFAKGFQCSGNITGDPFMMLIPPREQFLTNYTLSTVAGFTSHWVNVVVPDYALGTVLEDGALIPVSVFLPIGTSGFYGAQRQVIEGSHTFSSSFPFGVFSYGWAYADSYGYPGGGSLSPVATVNSVSLLQDTLYGELNVTTICLTALVLNTLGNPVEGVLVNFFISGLSTITGNAYTNSFGEAQYCYTQSGTNPGIDEVYAEVFGYLSDTAVVFWSFLPPCVNPTFAGTIGPNQSSCGSLIPAIIPSMELPTGHTGSLEYKWQSSTTNSTIGFTDIPSSNTPTLSLDTVPQTSWFRRIARVSCMPNWSGSDTSNVVLITITPVFPVSVSIIASDNPICAGTHVTYAATTQHKGAFPFFSWLVNGTEEGVNDSLFSYIPSDGDLVSCVLTSSETCISSNPAFSNSISMTVLEAPEVTFTSCFDTITTTNGKPIRLKGGIPLGGTYSGAGVVVSSGGSGGSGVTAYYFDPGIASPGTHILTYTYFNEAGCKDSSQIHVFNFPLLLINCGDSLTDPRDNLRYPTIQIGVQCWMASNLSHGTQIDLNISQRDNCLPEKYAGYGLVVSSFGLYQWDELMQYQDVEENQGLCPPAWHIPSEADWSELFAHYQGNAFAGSPLLFTGYSGFNALLSGTALFNRSWYFTDFATFFWSSTVHDPDKAWAHGMNAYNYSVSYYPAFRANAFSVRCVRD